MSDDPEELPPSKSARKREAHARQKLGEALVALKESDLDELQLATPLSEALRDAIREARRIRSRSAGARQRQFIGRLMREVDIEPLEQALAELRVGRNPRGRLPR